MLTSILGARMRRHLGNGWVFDPAIVGPDTADYTLKEGRMPDGMPSRAFTTGGWLQESKPRVGTRRAARSSPSLGI
jgi:hypothetical protein